MDLKPNNDDQCQHPDGCMKSLFTYCPHCHLYLCIIHLNQHHDAMKTDIHQIINEAENHRVSLEQQIDKIKQQQLVLNHLYEHEIKNLNDVHQFVKNICENSYLLVSDHERYAKQLQMIKQDQANNSFTQSFVLQIDQILQQQNHLYNTDKRETSPIRSSLHLESKDQLSMTTNILSTVDNETTLDSVCSESCAKEEEEEELVVDSTMDCHSEELSMGSLICNTIPIFGTGVVLDHHNKSDSDAYSLKSKSSANRVFPACPLSHVNALGLSIHHNIPNVPCNFLQNSANFTADRCYYHLLSYHRIRQRVARLILKTISSDENKTIDLTTLDVFSHWKSSAILSQGTTLLISQCPLTAENVYGLQHQHNVVLCTPRPPLHLYQHLRSFHHMKSNYARRLIVALIENRPSTEELFKPNEQIVTNSIRTQNRAKK